MEFDSPRSKLPKKIYRISRKSVCGHWLVGPVRALGKEQQVWAAGGCEVQRRTCVHDTWWWKTRLWRVVPAPLIPVVPVVHDPNPRSNRARHRRVSGIWLEHGEYLELRLHLDHRKR